MDQEVPIAGANQINVSLVPSTTALTEVVVVAYGTVKKENFTGSAAVIKEDVFANRPVTSFEKALQGAAAGVQVSSVSGQPGATSTVRIRGVGSFSASSSPLYVVDGIAITDGDLSQVAQTSDVLSSLNPNDIASVTVLKDATAAAIYGSRAGNGVVLITTKQGQAGKTQFSVTSSGGYSSQAVKKFDVLNASQYYKLFWDQFYNEEIASGTNPDAAALSANERTNDELRANPYSTENPYLANGVLANEARLFYDTDWRDAVQRRGVTKDVNLSASGGNDRIKYFISGGYFDQKGVIIASDFQRYAAKFNVSNEVTDFLSVGINNILSRTNQNTPAGSTGAANPVQFGDATANVYPLYELDENGNPVLDAKGNPIFNYINPVTPDFNPVGLSKLDEYNTKTSRVITSPYAELKFLDGFTAKTSIGIDYISNRERQFYNPEHGDGASVNGRGYRFSAEDLTVTFVNTLNYSNTFGKHNLNALLGQEAYKTKYDQLYAQATNFAFPGNNELVAGSTPSRATSYIDEKRLSSYFSRLEYNFDTKYYLSGSLRRDGSSVFGASNKYGTFYSIGGAWRIGKESFLTDVAFLDELKIRASYGTSGNDRIDRYAALGLYDLGENYEGQAGISYAQLANPLLRWEKNTTTDIGLEFSLFGTKLSGEVSYYKRGSEGILFDKPLSMLTGFETINTNLASMDNYGVELLLNGSPLRNETLEWNVSFNLTSNKNKIKAITQNEVIDGTKRWKVGQDRYQWYLREYAGVDPDDGSPMWYKDELGTDGVSTGNRITTKSYTSATRYDGLGSALPKFTGGLNNTIKFKSLDLSIFTYFSLGGKIYDGLYALSMHNGASVGQQLAADTEQAWKNPGDITSIPRFSVNNTDLGNEQSSRFLYDGSYLRVKNIAMGYTLDKKLLQPLKLSNVRLYLMTENVLTFAKHKGMDPESAITGLSDNEIPNIKTFSIGLNVGF